MWKDLDMKQKGEAISMMMDYGITSGFGKVYDDIQNNTFADGGNIQPAGDNPPIGRGNPENYGNYLQWIDLLAQKKSGEWGEPYSFVYIDMLNNNTYDYKAFYDEDPQRAWEYLSSPEGTHFDDIGKTVYHPSFSNESMYSANNYGDMDTGANPDNITGPSWNDNNQLIDKEGNVVFDENIYDTGGPKKKFNFQPMDTEAQLRELVNETSVQQSDATRTVQHSPTPYYVYKQIEEEKFKRAREAQQLKALSNQEMSDIEHAHKAEEWMLKPAEERLEDAANVAMTTGLAGAAVTNPATVIPAIIGGVIGTKGVDYATHKLSDNKYSSWGDMINSVSNDYIPEWFGELTNPGMIVGGKAGLNFGKNRIAPNKISGTGNANIFKNVETKNTIMDIYNKMMFDRIVDSDLYPPGIKIGNETIDLNIYKEGIDYINRKISNDTKLVVEQQIKPRIIADETRQKLIKRDADYEKSFNNDIDNTLNNISVGEWSSEMFDDYNNTYNSNWGGFSLPKRERIIVPKKQLGQITPEIVELHETRHQLQRTVPKTPTEEKYLKNAYEDVPQPKKQDGTVDTEYDMEQEWETMNSEGRELLLKETGYKYDYNKSIEENINRQNEIIDNYTNSDMARVLYTKGNGYWRGFITELQNKNITNEERADYVSRWKEAMKHVGAYTGTTGTVIAAQQNRNDKNK